MGQRMFVMPRHIIKWIKESPLIGSLYISDIGYFPNAANHFRERRKGCSSYILIYCISGKGRIKLADRELIILPNSFFIIPPETPHSYSAVDGDPWTIYWAHFKGPLAGLLYNKILKEIREENCNIKHDERRILLFENMLDILEKGYGKDHLEFINISLYQLLSSFIFPDNFELIGKAEEDDDLVDKSVSYVVENIDEKIDIALLARKFGYSNSHFLNLFKKKSGFAPLQYFNNLKIQRACHYLSFTDLSIKEICFSLGYNDPLYFSRLFKKSIGISPNPYRFQNQK